MVNREARQGCYRIFEEEKEAPIRGNEMRTLDDVEVRCSAKEVCVPLAAASKYGSVRVEAKREGGGGGGGEDTVPMTTKQSSLVTDLSPKGFRTGNQSAEHRPFSKKRERFRHKSG